MPTERLPDFDLDAVALAAAFPAWHARIAPNALRDACERAKAGGGRLIALWGSDDTDVGGAFRLNVALLVRSGLVWLDVALAAEHPHYPSIADIFPAASRMQRATYDLLGLHAEGNADNRKWLRHGAWPGGIFPLRRGVPMQPGFEPGPDQYAFVSVQGEGVHEIPVGPVHAGTIEPGHFRFSIVGEAVLRLEERLGYTHKGIEKRAEAMTIAQGAQLAGRVSGDSTVAYAWAYAQAVECLLGIAVPERAQELRALLLELERLHNHLGDLGYLGNDVALAFGFFQFWRLKEQVLRTNAALFGHRYLMDCVVPGGVARDLLPEGADALERLCAEIAAEVSTLRTIYDEHAGVQDRFMGAGQVAPALAEALGLTGLAGRASGLAADLRVDHPIAPYDRLDVRMATHASGDVAARVSVRFDEVFESLRLIRVLCRQSSPGACATELPPDHAGGLGVGVVEGWRGEVLVAVESADGRTLRRMHPHDPSWQNWPLIERAVLDNIVPDFPLINKSFNLSYSGHDL
jgi:Ni,Fe-hydrogenase III large subunit/Ni,Fe-hydrogenase III component G